MSCSNTSNQLRTTVVRYLLKLTTGGIKVGHPATVGREKRPDCDTADVDHLGIELGNRGGLLSGIDHPAHEEDRAGEALPDGEQERAVDDELRWCTNRVHLNGRDGRRFGALLVPPG